MTDFQNRIQKIQVESVCSVQSVSILCYVLTDAVNALFTQTPEVAFHTVFTLSLHNKVCTDYKTFTRTHTCILCYSHQLWYSARMHVPHKYLLHSWDVKELYDKFCSRFLRHIMSFRPGQLQNAPRISAEPKWSSVIELFTNPSWVYSQYKSLVISFKVALFFVYSELCQKWLITFPTLLI